MIPHNGEGDPPRHFFCREYDRCLTRAVKKEWPGFSCEGCRDYAQVEWGHADVDEDAERCMVLIYAIEHGGLTPKEAGRRLKAD